MTETKVTLETEAGATTSGQYKWIATITVDGWMVSRSEHETPASAWEWIYAHEV